MKNKLAPLTVPIGIVGIVLLLIVPVPAPLLDVLIVCNILLALLVLLTSMFVKKPLDFSVFPSLLLVATLFRLGLNVASTRLILGEGHAGQVIEAFGQVTVGGSMIIGAVVFLILVVIQFVVVTKGAERVAEVGARFTLDAMPGKQMAIDADLNAGLITDTQARERRAEVSAEADFYGAMDGASKFVKGDAIAGLIIIIINFVGGIAIGMLQRGMEIGDAVNTYGILTMGDGLVTQIPALLMAVSTGMIVTRSNAESDMGRTASTQLMQSPNALMIAGVAAIAMALIPGMPPLPFILVGAGLLFASRRIAAQKAQEEKTRDAEASALNFPEMDPNEKLLEDMRVHPVEILLAPDLVDMVSGASDDLLARVRSLRHKIAMELGLVIPPVRTRDSVDLPPASYSIRIAGVEAGARHRPQRPDAGPGRQPRLAPRHRDDRARVRPGREMDPGGNAAQRGDDRRHRDRPRLRPGHPPVLDRHGQRRPAVVPRGRPGPDRGSAETEPLRRRRTHSRAALPRRAAARAPGPAGRAGAHQRPGQDLRGAHPPREGLHRPGIAGRIRAAGPRPGADGQVHGRPGAERDHDRPASWNSTCSRTCAPPRAAARS